MPDESMRGVVAGERRRAANNALGICLVALFLLAETIVAHHASPSPYSPLIWSILGVTTIAAFFRYLLLARKGRQATWTRAEGTAQGPTTRDIARPIACRET